MNASRGVAHDLLQYSITVPPIEVLIVPSQVGLFLHLTSVPILSAVSYNAVTLVLARVRRTLANRLLYEAILGEGLPNDEPLVFHGRFVVPLGPLVLESGALNSVKVARLEHQQKLRLIVVQWLTKFDREVGEENNQRAG